MRMAGSKPATALSSPGTSRRTGLFLDLDAFEECLGIAARNLLGKKAE